MNRLMLLIGVLAVNLAVMRELVLSENLLIILDGFVLWSGLEIATFCSFIQKGRQRAFWVGFVFMGAISSIFYLASLAFPSSIPASLWENTVGIHAESIRRTIEVSGKGNSNAALRSFYFCFGLLHELLLSWLLPIGGLSILGGLAARQSVDLRR